MAQPKEMRRLQKELEEIKRQENSESQVRAEMMNEDLTQWRGFIKGPVGTPYEGGVFQLEISIPPEYPYTAPKIRFETRIWHPNVSSQTGAICLDVLKNEWSPALTIRTALLSIQALLSAPEPTDPQDAEVAKMYLANYREFARHAAMWTEMFAKPVSSDTKVAKLIEMGFDPKASEEALKENNWDETLALNALLGV